jgi:hypothetical protein
MRPDAVARRLSERHLALLDAQPEAEPSSPPGRAGLPLPSPTRFALPLHTIASDVSLAAMVPGNGDERPLLPPPPEEEARLRALSPFAAHAAPPPAVPHPAQARPPLPPSHAPEAAAQVAAVAAL